MIALDLAVTRLGLQPLARLCGVSYQAVRKWQRAGRLPRTEWTGETDYAARIAAALHGEITQDQLLAAPGRSAAPEACNQANQSQHGLA